ncbi:MAG: hypothetical protein B0A82_03670 [Alkalinema sp. CACIAM 70d]|nr:MAG: hypothetical protein B0A82_03670 [Alkalinema sp. CACIAM 70d]
MEDRGGLTRQTSIKPIIETIIVSMGVSMGLLVSLLVSIGFFLGMPRPLLAAEARLPVPPTPSPAAPTAPEPPCELPSVPNLRSTTAYGIFGDDEFDTVVCGYLVTRQEQHFDNTVNAAYLRIVRFGDPGFQQAIAQGIANQNSINQYRDGKYELNLGCLKNNKIVGIEYDRLTPYITPETQQQLQASSRDRPIPVVLSFGKHRGRDCECCNLAHKVRVYGSTQRESGF